MEQITNLLLKHGIEGLISENEDFFRSNVTQALAIKLNESINETKQTVLGSLLVKEEKTEITPELQNFILFVDKFNPGIYTFKNGSSINITESDLKSIVTLFESLNSKNRQEMVKEILSDGAAFKQHLEFSQKAIKLI